MKQVSCISPSEHSNSFCCLFVIFLAIDTVIHWVLNEPMTPILLKRSTEDLLLNGLATYCVCYPGMQGSSGWVYFTSKPWHCHKCQTIETSITIKHNDNYSWLPLLGMHAKWLRYNKIYIHKCSKPSQLHFF